MIQNIGDYIQGTGFEFLCPSCGDIYLHHDIVKVFERDEDADTGVHVVVGNGKATIDNSIQGNPSLRRHGLKIRFWCEGCDALPVLSIVQHKGCTYINFTDG